MKRRSCLDSALTLTILKVPTMVTGATGVVTCRELSVFFGKIIVASFWHCSGDLNKGLFWYSGHEHLSDISNELLFKWRFE